MSERKFGNIPTHPGEVVKDEIEYRKISQRKLSEKTGLPYNTLNEILNAKRPINATVAYLFEAALGVSAEMLLRIQLNYDMQITQSDKSFMTKIANIRKLTAVL